MRVSACCCCVHCGSGTFPVAKTIEALRRHYWHSNVQLGCSYLPDLLRWLEGPKPLARPTHWRWLRQQDATHVSCRRRIGCKRLLMPRTHSARKFDGAATTSISLCACPGGMGHAALLGRRRRAACSVQGWRGCGLRLAESAGFRVGPVGLGMVVQGGCNSGKGLARTDKRGAPLCCSGGGGTP